jgi:thiol-disulfide isomerase/thioredoxin
MILYLLACTPEPGKSSSIKDDSGSETGVSESEALDSEPPTDSDSIPPDCEEPAAPESRVEGNAPVLAREISGSVTWSLDFDSALEALGYQDCQYTRVYTGTERIDQQYLCPDCTFLAPAEADMVEGYSDCYLQIDDAEQLRTEMLGLGPASDGSGELAFYRRSGENLAPGELGPATLEGEQLLVSWSDEVVLETGESYLLEASGELSLVEGTELLKDPEDPRTEPYACGWALNDPGGDVAYLVEDGAVFPTARFEDQCGERPALRDFRGYYLVVDVSATNCGPCQQMAERAEAFKHKLKADCIPVEMVTLLAESLSTINIPASLETRQDWAATYGLNSPILGDEGFGYALLPEYMGYDGGMSYPTTVVLDPEGKLLGGFGGFGVMVDQSGQEIGSTFDDIEALIRSDL